MWPAGRLLMVGSQTHVEGWVLISEADPADGQAHKDCSRQPPSVTHPPAHLLPSLNLSHISSTNGYHPLSPDPGMGEPELCPQQECQENWTPLSSHIPGLSTWLSGKESACQCKRLERHGFDLWVGKSPWRRKWQPTLVFLWGKSHGQRGSWATVYRVTKSWARLNIHPQTLRTPHPENGSQESGPESGNLSFNPTSSLWPWTLDKTVIVLCYSCHLHSEQFSLM